jgi:hypothetical protein
MVAHSGRTLVRIVARQVDPWSRQSTSADPHTMQLFWYGLVVVGTLAACIGFGAFIGWRV